VKVGADVGAWLGKSVGKAVGKREGGRVGTGDGTLVGNPVGVMDGCLDGSNVGDAVGPEAGGSVIKTGGVVQLAVGKEVVGVMDRVEDPPVPSRAIRQIISASLGRFDSRALKLPIWIGGSTAFLLGSDSSFAFSPIKTIWIRTS
jgi:hypothetical protein